MIANVSIGVSSGASDASQAPTGAVVSLAGPKVWPGLNTQGVTHARLDFAIGGVVPLHTHPRAAETLLVLKGTTYTGFVSDDNVLYAATLQQGDVMLFPKALLHFQLNVGNETAIAFNTLTSQKPGLLLSSNQVRIVLSRVSFVSFCLLTQA
jgi:quercetin dioxygenase-like cupin family protein